MCLLHFVGLCLLSTQLCPLLHASLTCLREIAWVRDCACCTLQAFANCMLTLAYSCPLAWPSVSGKVVCVGTCACPIVQVFANCIFTPSYNCPLAWPSVKGRVVCVGTCACPTVQVFANCIFTPAYNCPLACPSVKGKVVCVGACPCPTVQVFANRTPTPAYDCPLAFPSGQGDSACVGAAQVQVTYPSLEAMVAYIQSRHAALKQVASTARGTLDMTKPLPLSQKAYLALITFLRQCRSKQKTLPEEPPQDYLGDAVALLLELPFIGHAFVDCISKEGPEC